MRINYEGTIDTEASTSDASGRADVRTLMGIVGLKEGSPADVIHPASPSDYIASHQVVTVRALVAACRDGMKIQAIKALRQLTGFGLTESKHFIEDHYFGPYVLGDHRDGVDIR